MPGDPTGVLYLGRSDGQPVTDLNTAGAKRSRRRFPVVTAVSMVVAVIFPFVPSMIAGDDYIPMGLEIMGPPVIGIIGAVLSLLHRSLEKDTRWGWAAVSASTGFVALPVLWMIGSVIEAIDWTVNGPPPGL
jgi:hypothetical protein